MKKGPDISEKTLVSWCYIDNLSIQAGSVLTIDQINADQFDAMVFGKGSLTNGWQVVVTLHALRILHPGLRKPRREY